MDQATLLKLAMGAGAAYAAYRFLPNATAKAAALGVLGVIVAKQIPYVKESLA